VKRFMDLELAKGLNMAPPEPGRRLFRVPMGGGISMVCGFELEVDPGGRADLWREIPDDVSIRAALQRAAVLVSDGECLRGGQA
jgi:hypothetical protein